MTNTAAKKEDKKKIVKKVKKSVSAGNVYVQSTFNNTIITITNENGDTVSWATSGSIGFKGTKKSTPYAAQLAAAAAIEKARSFGLSSVKVFVSGVGPGRDSAVRALTNSNIEVSLIKDITPIAHNGCRAKKARRV